MTKSPENDKQIEEAIKFLISAINHSGKNPKPVILHSLRVGLYLYNLGYDEEIIIAAILHDIIEDTDIKIEEIEQTFGKKVAELVQANSFDKKIEDKTNRYKENFTRCSKAGKDALIIKTADLLDNADYYHLASTKEMEKWLLEKLKFFIDNFKDELKDEVPYTQLDQKFKRIEKNI